MGDACGEVRREAVFHLPGSSATVRRRFDEIDDDDQSDEPSMNGFSERLMQRRALVSVPPAGGDSVEFSQSIK